MPVLHDRSEHIKARALGAETADPERAEQVAKRLKDFGFTPAEVQKCLAAVGLAARGMSQPVVPAGPRGEALPIGSPAVPTSPDGGPPSPGTKEHMDRLASMSAGAPGGGRRKLAPGSPMLKAIRVLNPRVYERLTGKPA